MKKIISKIIGISLIVLGIAVLLYPVIANQVNKKYMKEKIDVFVIQSRYEDVSEKDTLKQAFIDYNQMLYEDGQNIVDTFSYQVEEFNLREYGYSENIVAYIDVPKMNITLPIYLGATDANLNKGAALLSKTSIPIGGINSNSVIAAHRGLISNDMFRNIQKLKIGDDIKITNQWEELTYKVCDIKIIDSDDIDSILIQENRDLITLITCHPYRENYQRYVVYAERN